MGATCSMLDKSRVMKQIYSKKYEWKPYICQIRWKKYHNVTNYVILLLSTTDSIGKFLPQMDQRLTSLVNSMWKNTQLVMVISKPNICCLLSSLNWKWIRNNRHCKFKNFRRGFILKLNPHEIAKSLCRLLI